MHAVDLILQVNWRRQKSREMSEDKWMAIRNRQHSGRLINNEAHKTQKLSRQGEIGLKSFNCLWIRCGSVHLCEGVEASLRVVYFFSGRDTMDSAFFLC